VRLRWPAVYYAPLVLLAKERLIDETNQHRRLATARREKRINGPPPQPTLPAVRHAILELIARLATAMPALPKMDLQRAAA
jgi:hypothetical protein